MPKHIKSKCFRGRILFFMYLYFQKILMIHSYSGLWYVVWKLNKCIISIQIPVITIAPSKMILPHCARPMGRLNFFLPCWKWLKCINKFLLKAYTETLCSRKWEPSMYKLGLAQLFSLSTSFSLTPFKFFQGIRYTFI